MAKKNECINNLLSKIGSFDEKIDSLSDRLNLIKKIVKEHYDEAEEECPDVAESERAVIEAIEKLFVEELLTREPEGDA